MVSLSSPVPSLSSSSVAVAEFVSSVPYVWMYPESMSSAIVTVSSAPGARSRIGQVMVPAASEHAGVESRSLYVVPDGTSSVSEMPVESESPLLVTVIV